MKKSFYFVLFSFLVLSQTQAQYYTTPIGSGNPGNKNTEDLEYSVGGGLPASWTIIQSGLVTLPVWSAVQNLPFAFDFNGSPVTSYKVSTSGVLTFTTTASAVPSSMNTTLPNVNIPANSICIWGLSGKGSNDNIVTKTFGTAPNRQVWISFNDYSLQTLFNSHYTYWSIVLEETTNHIYIVDQRKSSGLTTALTLGLQVNSSTAYSISGSPTINAASTDNPARTDNVFYTFEPGTKPNRDIKGLQILLADIIAANNGPFAVKFVYENLGSDTITSLDLKYGNPASGNTTATITNLSILPWQIDTLEHPVAWSPAPGLLTLMAWAENLNGAADEVPGNDTAIKVLTIIAQSAIRVPLLESFTSSTSTASKSFNATIESTLYTHPSPVVHIKYPMNWPGTGDPYFTNEGGTRRQFYAVSTLPNLQIDGKDWSNYNYNLNPSTLSSLANKMTLLNLEASFYTTGQTVCASITIDPLIDMNNADVTLYVAVYEKKTINNIKTSGDTEFYHVMKKMLPNANGTQISSLTSGVQHHENFCFTFVGSYILPPNANSPVNLNTNHTIEEFSDLGVVAWLQNNTTKEVLQAAEAADSTSSSTFGTIENEKQNFTVSVFPNPTSGEVFIQLTVAGNLPLEIDLMSLTGQHLLRQKHANVSGNVLLPVALPQLSAGVYLLNLRVGDKTISQKLLID